MSLLDPPAFDADPWDETTLLDPYGMYEEMRNLAPIVWLSKYDMYAVARHEECKTVLSDYARFMTGAGTTMYDIRKPGLFRIPSRLQEVDPPLHTKIRRVVTRVMSPVAIRKMRVVFAEIAEAMAKDLLAKESFDGVGDLAEPYVVSAFPAAVGVRLKRKEALAIAEMRFNQSCPHNAIYHKAMVNAEPYMEWFEQACLRKNVEPGSIADLVYQAEEAGQLDEGVAQSIVRSFVGGGVDSTIGALGHSLHHLARNPDQFARARENPKLIRSAFEEAIRLDTPFQYTWRTTTKDCELSNYRLKADTKVTVLLGAANRDPRRWEDAEHFDIDRQTVGNYLGFGVADHNCIGQMIARHETDAIMIALFRGAQTLQLTDVPIYRAVNQMRMLKSLPLRVT